MSSTVCRTHYFYSLLLKIIRCFSGHICIKFTVVNESLNFVHPFANLPTQNQIFYNLNLQ